MNSYLSYFLVMMLCIWAVKTIKYQRMRYFKFLSLSDINACVVVAVLMGFADAMPSFFKLVGLCMLSLILLFMYVDAVAFQVYSAEIEPSSVKLFLKNFDTMKGEKSAAGYLKKEKNFIFVPAVLVFFGGGAIGVSSLYITAVYLGCMILLVTKTRINVPNVALFIGMVIALIKAQERWLSTSGLPFDLSLSFSVLGGLLLTVSTVEYLRFSKSYLFQHSFMTQSSSVFSVLGLNSLGVDHSIEPTEDEVRSVIPVAYPLRQPSSMAKAFTGSNIILISLESVGRQHMAYYQREGALMPVFEALAKRAYVSRCHYCISPNTHTSIHTLLNGDYMQQERFPHIASLKANGYTTSLLTAQNFLVDTKELLKKNEYDHYFTPDFYADNQEGTVSGWGGNDYAIFEKGAEDFIRTCEDGKPFFLHVTNNQTHINYTVYDTERFGRFQGGSAKHRYLNAVEESDYLMGRLLDRLREAGLLENTLIVYTSDHGQAFGELGYRAHSTAISAEEMNVPFLIHHPSLDTTRWIQESNHFDLFPTLFDLTGIACHEKTLGSSLFSDDYKNQFVGFSSTRKGQFPSNFGMIRDGRKVMIDLVLSRFWTMDCDDKGIETLPPLEQKHTLKVMHDALSNRGLVY